METIIQVRKLHFGPGAGSWQATETTADCARWIGHRGTWPTLAEAVRALRPVRTAGADVRIQATAGEIAEARTALETV